MESLSWFLRNKIVSKTIGKSGIFVTLTRNDTWCNKDARGISSKVEDVHPEKRTKSRCSSTQKVAKLGKNTCFLEIFLIDAGTTPLSRRHATNLEMSRKAWQIIEEELGRCPPKSGTEPIVSWNMRNHHIQSTAQYIPGSQSIHSIRALSESWKKQSVVSGSAAVRDSSRWSPRWFGW